MKIDKKYSYISVVVLLLFIVASALGAFTLTLERNLQASIAKNISNLNLRIEKLERSNIDLKTRIANLENPAVLKKRVGSLEPISENIVVWQGYDSLDNRNNSMNQEKQIVLDFNAPTKIGTIKTIRR